MPYPHPHDQRMLVTVEQARAWLVTSEQPIEACSQDRIDYFATLILEGDWAPDRHRISPIRIVDGRLEHGNHRLRAINQAEVPAMMWVRNHMDARSS